MALLYYFRIINLKIVVALIAVAFVVSHWQQIKAPFVKPEPFDPKIKTIIDEINAKESAAIEPIPRIVIQIWVDKTQLKTGNYKEPPKIPKDQIEYMEKMRKLNPEFQHLFFDGRDIKRFFESNYPEYYDTYKRLPAFIQKLDFFRYLAVYHYGGFYFDMDVEPNKPLDAAILNHQAVFPIDEYGDSTMCASVRMKDYCDKKRPFLLGQYAFGATAKHPFLKYVVDKIHKNVDIYIEASKQVENSPREQAHYYVFKTTGPDFITDCYNRYGHTSQFYILSTGKRQVFGDYATHKYAGVWK